MAASFGQGGMACLKDTAPPWSKKPMMFWQGLYSLLRSSHETEHGRDFPGLLFT